MNIYEDFLSKPEIEFLTGRKLKSSIIKQLNIMGIPFKLNANGYPIVRRDYNHSAKKQQGKKSTEWMPTVLKT
ncbi:hypothetical protein BKG89_08190 [Rodentibacter caecimuris]|uniref:DUF4224 domain-containing protein n=1 Tax=Rodentibacter caecimuris TaxID=1796644 RepID=A0ABX3KXE7_9PAST|nr:hypothetical protein BKG89_08190 [Rodentibacter heylii]